MENKVYCIIVTYNAMKWVDKCFGSLRSSKVPIHPVVVDNGSKDNTIEYISSNYPETYIISNSTNKGFGQANNQGIEYAYKNGASHFFLLNQDAWVREDTVELLIQTMEENGYAVVSPIQLNGAGNSFDSSFCRAAIFNTKNVAYISGLVLGSVKSSYEVVSVPAACWLISRKTIEMIGGFDPLFFHYGEDSNFCQRLQYHKLTIAFATNAFVNHDRKEKGNVTLFNKLDMLRSLYLEYAGVNRPSIIIPTSQRCKLHFHLIHNLIKGCITFNSSLLCDSIRTIYEFYSHIPSIISSKKNNRLIKPNWLILS